MKLLIAFCSVLVAGCVTSSKVAPLTDLTYETPVDPGLQGDLEEIDAALRDKFLIAPEQRSVGLIDLKTSRVAVIHPDRIEYAASVPKIGILLAWFKLHPEAATNLDPKIRRELGLMIKASSNEMASRFSQELGLDKIQEVLNAEGFYDPARGGGIWVGKHYGITGQRIPDPVGGHSHGATVRQLLRFYLLLDRERLISPEASRVMRQIFESPDIPHDDIKFVKGLSGRDVRVLRKWDPGRIISTTPRSLKAPGALTSSSRSLTTKAATLTSKN